MGDRIGQRLGNYRLTRLLGQGGFAEVYLGEHVYLKTLAAVKMLHNRLTSSEELTKFLDEARMIAHLSHPHIVRVLDFGVDGEIPFLVMDYAAGGTLRQRHKRGERLPVATIAQYVKQVADALQYAHDEKVVHRDIKPENMLVGQRQEILLSDFGIALVAQSSRYQSTQDVVGTVAYMSPEQIQGKPRPTSDQYSLGIAVYEWLCGERPFSGSFTELCTQHLFAPVPPLREKVPTISPEIEQVITIALAKEPKERFGSVQAFAAALEAASQTAPTQLRGAVSLASPLSSSPQQAAPPIEIAPPVLPPTIPATPPALSPTIPVTPSAYASGQKGSTQKRRWNIKAIIAASMAILIVCTGSIGYIFWNNAQTAAHVTALNTAYQSIARNKPFVEYTTRDQFSQQNWQSANGNPGCTFGAQGYLVSDIAKPDGGSLVGACQTAISLYDPVGLNLLVQVTMNIQSGTCGGLAIGDLMKGAQEADLCIDGTTAECDALGGECPTTATNAIHQGLHKDNVLALEVVASKNNNQGHVIAFINGQYVVEWATQQSENVALDPNIILKTGFFESSAPNSILYKDVKVWKVSNPVS